jgi:hypothetical protein
MALEWEDRGVLEGNRGGDQGPRPGGGIFIDFTPNHIRGHADHDRGGFFLTEERM